MMTRRFNRTLPFVPLVSALILLATPGSTSGVQPMPVDGMTQAVDTVQQCTLPFPQVQTLIDRGYWMAVSSSGDVMSRAPGADTATWVAVRRGDRVESLSLVKATGRGQATLTRNGDVILVSPGAELTLPEGDVSGDVIRQDGGKALYKVKPGREGRRFEVVTPMLVAGVKGTQFSVVVREDFVAVEVVEGHVEVQSLMNSADRVDLFAGDLVSMRRDDGRLETYGEDRRREDMPSKQRFQEVKDIRSDTKDLVSDLADETSVFDVDTLWQDGMTDSVIEETLPLDIEDTTRLFEEKQTTKVTDDLIKILSGGTVSRGTSATDSSGSGSSSPTP